MDTSISARRVRRKARQATRDCGVDTSELQKKDHQILDIQKINTELRYEETQSSEEYNSPSSSLSSISTTSTAVASISGSEDASLPHKDTDSTNLTKGQDVAINHEPLVTKCHNDPEERISSKRLKQTSINDATDSPATPMKETASKPGAKTMIIIAHDKNVQDLMDHYRIAKGIQFEIARGVTEGRWDWDDITREVLRKLRGTNLEVGLKLSTVIGKGDEELSPLVLDSRRNIFKELDREHDALMEGRQRGLGLMGPWEGEENWYGGRIQLTAKLRVNKHKSEKDGLFSVRLAPYGIGKSNRATRYCTSLSILQIKIEKDSEYALSNDASIADLLGERFVLCGRIYCPFHTKEGKLFLVECSDNYERQPVKKLGDGYRRSFDDFLKWHNPIERNSGQALSKWLARWALILSTSRPVLQFSPENIFLHIDDAYSETGNVMTDGCGWMNGSALREIAQQTHSTLSCVVQGRIAGAKGVWYLHPDVEHQNCVEPPKIWIRKSQLKVEHDTQADWDRSLLIFDLVRLARLTVPSSLYMQTILNMSYNGVKTDVFNSLMERGLEEEIGTLKDWTGPTAQTRLINAVERAGGIKAARLSRAAGADARLYGYIKDEEEKEGLEDDSSLVERDPNSGYPNTIFESAREMLLAGFTPFESSVLRDKIRHILSEVVNSYLELFRIPVALSVEAFIVPDPYGVLAEDEIYFRSSKEVDDPTISLDPYTFKGPVLVTRNPTRVASDVRKVKAVHHDKLLCYKDVIIFSIKGKRSLASYLGGGDYDGDTVTIIADPDIVDGFKNSKEFDEPKNLRNDFEQEVEKVTSFMKRMKGKSPVQIHKEIFKKITVGLATGGKVGQYSHFHDNAVYSLGYDDPDTVRLAYMFTTCLDSVKTGLRVKRDVFKKDSKKWNRPRPHSMQKKDEFERNDGRAELPLNRPARLGPFVLTSIKNRGEELKDQIFKDFKALCEKAEDLKKGKHNILALPFENALIWARCQKEKGDNDSLKCIEKIRVFVRKLRDDFVSEASSVLGEKRKGTTSTSTKSFSEICRRYSSDFNKGPDDVLFSREITREIAASYAYIICYGYSGWTSSTFPFIVAFSTLCGLKAKASPSNYVSMTSEASDYCILSNSLVKTLDRSKRNEEE